MDMEELQEVVNSGDPMTQSTVRNNNDMNSNNKNNKQTTNKAKGRKSRKRERRAEADDEEEQRLTALLFGKRASNVILEEKKHEKKAALEDSTPSQLFEIDRVGQLVEDPEDEDVQDLRDSRLEISPEEKGPSHGAAAWSDPDDAHVQVSLLETSRLRKLRQSRTEEKASALPGDELEERLRLRYRDTQQRTARTDWAIIRSNDDNDNDQEQADGKEEPLLAMALGGDGPRKLPPNLLQVVRCPDANLSDPNQAVVQAVHFHPGSDEDRPLLLTAGLDKTLRFFQVGPEKSEKIHGIHFPKLPIFSAWFLGTTGNVVVTGRRKYFYLYDAVAGKTDLIPRIMGREEKSLEKCVASPDGRTVAFVGNDGYIILWSVQSKQWIADLKMNGSVRALAFTPNGDELVSSGSDGDVYRWDLRNSRQCIERFANQDGTITSSLATSNHHLAVGAESGVVNLYADSSNNRHGFDSTRTPIKSIMNLSTSADAVRFNGDGQILAMSSQREKDSLKLLHVPSATVFSNWPTSKTPLGYVWSTDFSPGSKFLAVGNDRGRCLLYKLGHYDT